MIDFNEVELKKMLECEIRACRSRIKHQNEIIIDLQKNIFDMRKNQTNLIRHVHFFENMTILDFIFFKFKRGNF